MAHARPKREWFEYSPYCRLLHRTLTSPAMEAMHERHAHLQSPPPKPSFSRRCAELQQAHATHSCIEKAAALAVPTPMVKNVLISDFLGTPRKGPEASPCWTNSSELMTPYSNATPKYLKSPSAHAEQTLQVLFPAIVLSCYCRRW